MADKIVPRINLQAPLQRAGYTRTLALHYIMENCKRSVEDYCQCMPVCKHRDHRSTKISRADGMVEVVVWVGSAQSIRHMLRQIKVV